MQTKHPLRRFYDVIDSGSPQEKLKRLPDFPRMIELEITNHCNFRCVMCRTGTGLAKRPRGFMEDAIYEKLVDEMAGKPCGLKFVGQGEPTLHKHFLNFVRMAKARGIVCHLTTNGSMMTEEYIRELINSGLDSVKFSFQGANARGYAMMRRTGDYEELLRTIERLHTLREEGKTPFITIGTSVTDEAEEDIERFRARCEKICDKLEIGITSLQFVDLSVVTEPEIRLPLEEFQRSQKQQFRRYVSCPMVFDVLAVHWNGTVCACCADTEEKMALGSLQEGSLTHCWNSPRELQFRKVLAERRYEALPLCQSCYDIYGWTYGDNYAKGTDA